MATCVVDKAITFDIYSEIHSQCLVLYCLFLILSSVFLAILLSPSSRHTLLPNPIYQRFFPWPFTTLRRPQHWSLSASSTCTSTLYQVCDCFYSVILGYAEDCLKGHNAGHVQHSVYFLASFSLAEKLNSLTHEYNIKVSNARIVLSSTLGQESYI